MFFEKPVSINEMKRIWSVLTSPVVSITAVFSAWLVCELYHGSTSSAVGITTYHDYRESLPTPKAVGKLSKDGGDYYIFYGPIKAPLALPSGPPAYVFDMNGKLVDWAKDPGENPRFSSAWAGFKRETVEIDSFEKLLAHRNVHEQRTGGDR